jgi:hypothetical protein
MSDKKSPPEMADALARARRVSPTLHTATDRLNAALKQTEQILKAMNLGVTASVRMSSPPGGLPGLEKPRFLTFGKQDREWLLMVEVKNPLAMTLMDTTPSSEFTPLQNASRELRLEASRLLPHLINELIKASEAAATQVVDSADALEALNQRLLQDYQLDGADK